MIAFIHDEMWYQSRSPNAAIDKVGSGSKPKLTEKKCQRPKLAVTNARNTEGSKGVGSRRIFSPIFKLQVLDSYRHDADCQGNQRATARKYGIHRRQIQKWLQMETTLRMSVQQCTTAAKTTTSASTATTYCTSVTTALNLASTGSNKLRNLESIKTNIVVVNNGNNNNDFETLSTTSSSPVSSSPLYSRSSSTTSSSKENNVYFSNTSSDCDEYINVDEITDTETEELDDWKSGSSSSSDDKALDFTRATLSRRKFYTTDFKLNVVDAFKNNKTCKGNQRATARKFGIHRRQVQKWLNRENLIRSQHFSSASNLCLDLSPQLSKRKLTTDIDRSSPCQQCTDSSVHSFKKSKSHPPLSSAEQETGPTVKDGIWSPVQESALCLVKEKSIELRSSPINNPLLRIDICNNDAITIDHSYLPTTDRVIPIGYPPASSVSVDYTSMYCFCSPWTTCCYRHVINSTIGSSASVSNSSSTNFAENNSLMYPKYNYAFDDIKLSSSDRDNTSPSYVDIPLQYGFGESLAAAPKWFKETGPFYLHEQPANTQVTSYK